MLITMNIDSLLEDITRKSIIENLQQLLLRTEDIEVKEYIIKLLEKYNRYMLDEKFKSREKIELDYQDIGSPYIEG